MAPTEASLHIFRLGKLPPRGEPVGDALSVLAMPSRLGAPMPLPAKWIVLEMRAICKAAIKSRSTAVDGFLHSRASSLTTALSRWH